MNNSHHLNVATEYGYPVQQREPPGLEYLMVMMMTFPNTSNRENDLGQWLFDSGASNHYTVRKKILYDFTSIGPIWIMTGKGYISARA